MRIIIAGGSGFIGTALAESLLSDGHQVWILSRHPETALLAQGAQSIGWDGKTPYGWGEMVSQVDAIVNLAGENLGSGLWTRARKIRILSSRVDAGKAICTSILQSNPRPKVLIQASAVGFYGPHGAELVTEESPIGTGFLAEVCQAWESSTFPVEGVGVRRVIIRTGIVISLGKGAFQRLLLPFKLFAGGPLGSGRQGFPWIHPFDEVAAIRYLMDNNNAHGAFNLSAPEPLSNSDFSRVLAKVIRRPYWFRVPAFAMRLILGEMSALALDGTYLFPKRLQDFGFNFRYKSAESALKDLFSNEGPRNSRFNASP
jgi:uncharacterized protein (TIGR01777 family)